MRAMCLQRLLNSVTLQNAVELWGVADKCSDSTVKDACVACIVRSTDRCVTSLLANCISASCSLISLLAKSCYHVQRQHAHASCNKLCNHHVCSCSAQILQHPAMLQLTEAHSEAALKLMYAVMSGKDLKLATAPDSP